MLPSKKTNDYSVGIRKLEEERLREYVLFPENFHDEAILAAIWELGSRRPLMKDEIMLESEIEARINAVMIPQINTTESVISVEASLPYLYSIKSIHIFSLLFSVLAGGILMAINFNRTQNKVEVLKVLGFSLLYTFICVIIFSLMGIQSPFFSVLLNLLGGYLISEIFWKRVFGPEYRYLNANIWKALLVAFIIISPLLWYVMKLGLLESF